MFTHLIAALKQTSLEIHWAGFIGEVPAVHQMPLWLVVDRMWIII